jgi:hypothetical protein
MSNRSGMVFVVVVHVPQIVGGKGKGREEF